ncbi:hypothetical protein MTR_8g030990 [Medicago truncatula]|uniref:Uncharacterized protein n=1 Tax=Medicago truncatula TaxID=3880 RepID=A0A072TNB2_MEDTR|nr:hypothetical protein MTR_8g030990 [Medicago truncatula]
MEEEEEDNTNMEERLSNDDVCQAETPTERYNFLSEESIAKLEQRINQIEIAHTKLKTKRQQWRCSLSQAICATQMQVVTLKPLDRNGFQRNKEFLAEFLAFCLLNHPNLFNLVELIKDGNVCLVTADNKTI